MDKNHSNTHMTSHLQYHWWQYVLLAVISIMVWTAVFDTLAQPAKNEKVGIVFFGDGLDTAGLHAELSGVMDSLTRQEIDYVDVSQTIVDHEQLGAVMMARAYDYDLLVLTAETADRLSAYGFFAPLPDDWKDIPTYSQEKDGTTVAYGLEIYRPGSQNRFSQFCSGEQTYYVFLSKDSVNLAALNGNGAPEDDAALQMLNYLLEEPYGNKKEN
ncbi:MAG: hypothetical protein J6B67_01680 [Oscillospiraceae bacterium]|nr:hypothetical protein [Oscillospiraceae bacterium]